MMTTNGMSDPTMLRSKLTMAASLSNDVILAKTTRVRYVNTVCGHIRVLLVKRSHPRLCHYLRYGSALDY